MRVIRFNTALGLLLTGVLLMPAQFVLLTQRYLTTHHGVAATGLTSEATQDTQAAPCHDESAPTDQGPKNHDCCMLGHLHATGSAQASISPPFDVTSVNSSVLASGSFTQTASRACKGSDTGPPGSTLAMRI